MSFNPLGHAVLSARSKFLQQRLQAAPPEPQPIAPPGEEQTPQPRSNNFRRTIRHGMANALGNWWQRLTGS